MSKEKFTIKLLLKFRGIRKIISYLIYVDDSKFYNLNKKLNRNNFLNSYILKLINSSI